MVSFIASSHNPTIVNNGALYLRIVGPNLAVLGVLIETRSALQGIGQKILPLISSIIEFFGKIIFVIVFIPRFKYTAVIFCEPVIWIVMTIYLVAAFWRTDFIRKAQ
jgi:Na+-driven multidrug efflux pump